MALPSDQPVRDPAGMRRFARGLRAEAEALASRAAWLARRADRATFEGPAAEPFRQSMLDSRRAVERASVELREIANYVLSAAARVETDQADWKRHQATLPESRGRAS